MRTLLRALLDERGWQYPIFKAAFERAARELAEVEGTTSLALLSVSESTFDRWCAGQVRPQPDARRVLAHLLGYSADELVTEAPTRAATAVATPGEETLNSPAGSLGPGTQEMERIASMAANRALRWALTAESAQVGPETMAHVHEEVRRLAADYPRVPLSSILNDLVDVQDLTFRILESGRAKPAQARDLHMMAAITSGLLAKAAHDLGDPASAMRQARAAYICADQADHAPMRGWVRGLQSLIAYWAGRPEDARHYAQSGASIAHHATGSVQVWLAALDGRASAALGDAGSVELAVRAITEARERVQPDDLDEIGGLLTFPRVRQLYYTAESEVLLPVGNPHVERHAQDAVDAYAAARPAEWAWSDEAGARTNLALARISGGQLDGAAEALRPVLDLRADQRSAGVVVSAQRVHRALTAEPFRAATPARELRAEIEAFTSGPTRALPR